MNELIYTIIIAVAFFLVVLFIFSLISNLVKHIVIVKWDESHAKRKAKKELAEKRKQSEKYCSVKQGNKILDIIVNCYNIIIWGPLGAGKTLVADLIAKYLCDKYNIEDKKNRRYNKYMRPDYMNALHRLKQNHELRVSSNIPLTDNLGNHAGDLWLYITQQKQQVERAVELWDEIGTFAGKDLYYDQDTKNTWEVKKIDEHFRYKRQDCEVVTIGTEQSRDNIFKPIRDKGFLEIQAIKTYTYITKLGNINKKFLSFFNLVLPGWFTTNLKSVFQKCYDKKDIIKLFFRLFLPKFFLLPREFYLRETKISINIKKKFLQFKAIISLAGFEYMFKFGQKDIFNYNTTGHRENYQKQFDEEGNNKYYAKQN